MFRRTTRALRWNLRRALLGAALVLHLGWLALGVVPAASAAALHGDRDMAGMASMPCHERAAPTAPHTGPSPMPCCTHGCACAAGPCLMQAMAAGMLAPRVRLRLATLSVALPPNRTAAPELRPPISA